MGDGRSGTHQAAHGEADDPGGDEKRRRSTAGEAGDVVEDRLRPALLQALCVPGDPPLRILGKRTDLSGVGGAPFASARSVDRPPSAGRLRPAAASVRLRPELALRLVDEMCDLLLGLARRPPKPVSQPHGRRPWWPRPPSRPPRRSAPWPLRPSPWRWRARCPPIVGPGRWRQGLIRCCSRWSSTAPNWFRVARPPRSRAAMPPCVPNGDRPETTSTPRIPRAATTPCVRR